MTHPLFVYGTLRPGFAPAEIASAVAQLHPIAEAHLQGTLYHLGQYPGLMLNPITGKVHGIVFQFPPDDHLAATLLAQLDTYEDFHPHSPADSQFVRVLHPVTLDDGRSLPCWVYLYNMHPGSAPILASGRYRRAEDTAPCNSFEP
jgi:gamma-glutamylcyclotransferase (GGCT)/AIG2-like uncharacterized protein YtfP